VKSIKLTVSPKGETKIEAFGFQGADCLQATLAIERAIGKVTDRELKPEAQGGGALATITQGS
jgi:hypothetical protein